MTIDFKVLHAELDKIEKLQIEAQKEIKSSEEKVQMNGKLKQAACFATLAESYEKNLPHLKDLNSTMMRIIINTITK